MKYINLKNICLVFTVLFMVSCQDDFLDRPSQSDISTENFYQTKEDLRLATAALYGKPWAQWNNKTYIPFGDVMSGNIVVPYQGGDLVELNTFTLNGSNARLTTGWKALYIVIAHCNITIKAIENTKATINEADKNAAISEAKFIRAMAYYHLALLWGDVPIIVDNQKLITSPLVNRNLRTDVYRFITEDLIFAAKNLPLTDTPGRVTTWSAKGLLSKVYLTMAGLGQSGGTRNQQYLDLAKNTAKDVIQNSGLVLFHSYKDLFRTQFNDSSESLFSLQWTTGANWDEGNMLLTYSPSMDINPQKAGGYGGTLVSYDLYLAYAEKDSIRRKTNFMITGDHYPELNAAEGGYTATYPTMKKHIIGNEVDNNAPAMTFTSSILHTPLLRLADIYLVYAEAILGNNASTANADALQYFNMVRKRAGVDPVLELNMDVILKERRLEFACEGQYWFDLVRLSYFNPAKAISLISNQERRTFKYDSTTKLATPDDFIGVISPATVATFTLQLPSTEIIANRKLTEPSVPYYE
ncbi:RagB/SusD family nutrient uptake outer membrane protein [Flavobacterium johnsoniae]|uniref:Starch-binding associating with outer membrane n=1 Tax=Flavobacterium johnsoniae TaxID=986 RepID=A0A1M5QW79_FLAJO|nr:RagB/SusD family nutrient uptake outer membrane protein [Flavobacterium johnsoniae]SHH18136.1 Starch-binding associating with outer membrane [Flavobacterium johnsoniae]